VSRLIFQDSGGKPSWYDGWPFVFARFYQHYWSAEDGELMYDYPCVSHVAWDISWSSTNCSTKLPFVCKHTVGKNTITHESKQWVLHWLNIYQATQAKKAQL